LESVSDALALVELGIDFSEENVAFLTTSQLQDRIVAAESALRDLLDESTRFERLAHQPRMVLVGRPNAGKSSLLNALAQTHRGVVSPSAGTTRDAIWAEVRLRRGFVQIIDVAGLDEAQSDEISRKMQQSARRSIESADALVLVRDVTDRRPTIETPVAVDLIVGTKLDLVAGGCPRAFTAPSGLDVSALTGSNLQRLRESLDEIAFGRSPAQAALALNARHEESIREAQRALSRARAATTDGCGAEVIALELREALDALGRVLGEVSPDDVIGRIFAGFCIGK
jgi:tRNA modification GTPase